MLHEGLESLVAIETRWQLQRLAPFGVGNPEPVFVCRSLEAHEVKLLPDKRGSGPGHLKLRVGSTPREALDAIGFGLGAAGVQKGARVDAAFQLALDSYFGTERLQLKLKDVQKA